MTTSTDIQAGDRLDLDLTLLEPAAKNRIEQSFDGIHRLSDNTFHAASCKNARKKLKIPGAAREVVLTGRMLIERPTDPLAQCCRVEHGGIDEFLVALNSLVRDKLIRDVPVLAPKWTGRTRHGIKNARQLWANKPFSSYLEVLFGSLEKQLDLLEERFEAWVSSPQALRDLEQYLEFYNSANPGVRTLAGSTVTLSVNLFDEVINRQLSVKGAFLVLPPELTPLIELWEDQCQADWIETSDEQVEAGASRADVFTATVTDADTAMIETAATFVNDGMDVAAAVAAARALT